MVNYIFLGDSILKVDLSDSIPTGVRDSSIRWIKAVDLLNENDGYSCKIEYTGQVAAFNRANKGKRVEHAIFLFFRQHYLANSLEKLQGDSNPIITTEIIKSLFSKPPSILELQNYLITLLYRVFRIKSDILYTIDDLIVSTGYHQDALVPALKYLEEIKVIEKRPTYDEYNVPINTHTLDEKYSIKQKICEEYDKLRENHNMNIYDSKYFKSIEIEPESEFCFVLMPFKEEEFRQNWYKKFLKPFLKEEFNIECYRVDDDFLPNKIDDKLFTFIAKAKFIIAEISTLNPNVMYEIGMAHTLSKSVILLRESIKETAYKIPFDINNIMDP